MRHFALGSRATICASQESLERVLRIHVPSLWDALDGSVQGELVASALEEAPSMLEGFMHEVQEDVTLFLDIKQMTIDHFSEHPEDLNHVFQVCGAQEFKFIERSGLLFGFLFGIFQAILWFFLPEWWTLPLAGFVVGFLTNFLALKMIFEPIDPIDICGYKLQGIFLKRQKEVSRVFAEVNTEVRCVSAATDFVHCCIGALLTVSSTLQQLLNSEHMWGYMLHGSQRDHFEKTLMKHVDKFTDRLVGKMKLLFVLYLGADVSWQCGSCVLEGLYQPPAVSDMQEWVRVKREIALSTVKKLPEHIWRLHDYSNEALDLRTEMRVKMEGLSPRQLDGVLHPVFEEDELKLILVGAALGVGAGLFQAFVVFA